MDMDRFVGRWEVTSTENMDEMLRAFDMAEDKRQMYADMKFIMEYSHSGDQWTYSVHMPGGMSQTFHFAVGVEYDSRTLDGRPIVSLVNINDGRFEEHHKDKDDPTLDAEMTREIAGDELIVRAKVKNITSITRHKKIP